MPVARENRSVLIGRIVDDADGRAALELIQRWKVESIQELLKVVCPDGTPTSLTFDVLADAFALNLYLKDKA
jgi:hypothetical protein